MKTRLIPILLILALLLGMVPAMAAEPELKGSLGESIAWELEPVEGVLTLTSPTLGSCKLTFTIIPEVK